ncbi:MAG: flagellar hook-basal body complex protein [Rhodospirillaceae bacterium]|nr:flagellar hook-basal body complex protein [Rhodospirillaceae bacterium]
MSILGGFASSMLGMMTQSKALDSIGMNIANINTDGYKKHDTQFQTILSRTSSGNSVSDLGGVKPITRPNVIRQGEVASSERDLDVAIFGEGFFVLNTKADGTGETLYTRDGSFQAVPGADISVLADDGVTQITTQEKFLIDKNGLYVMGWAAQQNGIGFDTAGAYGAMRIDPHMFQQQGVGTTTAKYIGNIPNQAAPGDTFTYNMEVFDSNGAAHTLIANFTRTANDNEWTLSTDYQMTPIAQVTSTTLSGTVEAGDTFSVVVAGQTITYNVTGSEASMDAVRDGLVAALNANAVVSQEVTASAGGAGEIILTANVANSAFSVNVFSAQGLASTPQTSTVTLTGALVGGQSFSVDIDGTLFTVNGPLSLNAARDALALAIDTDPNYSATAATADGEFTVTSGTVGGTFNLVASASDIANSATSVITTPAYLAITDNTISAPTNTVTASSGIVSTAPVTLTFDANAKLVSPTTVPYNFTWPDGATNSIALDISGITQYTGEFYTQMYDQDGYGSGSLSKIEFNEQGHVVGQFSSSFSRPLYQLSLAIFANPNEMEQLSGNLYKPTKESGNVTLTTAGDNGFAVISPFSKELSNVDVAEEFAKMITVQGAYNASATVFRTLDEMTITAKDLKR